MAGRGARIGYWVAAGACVVNAAAALVAVWMLGQMTPYAVPALLALAGSSVALSYFADGRERDEEDSDEQHR